MSFPGLERVFRRLYALKFTLSYARFMSFSISLIILTLVISHPQPIINFYTATGYYIVVVIELLTIMAILFGNLTLLTLFLTYFIINFLSCAAGLFFYYIDLEYQESLGQLIPGLSHKWTPNTQYSALAVGAVFVMRAELARRLIIEIRDLKFRKWAIRFSRQALTKAMELFDNKVQIAKSNTDSLFQIHDLEGGEVSGPTGRMSMRGVRGEGTRGRSSPKSSRISEKRIKKRGKLYSASKNSPGKSNESIKLLVEPKRSISSSSGQIAPIDVDEKAQAHSKTIKSPKRTDKSFAFANLPPLQNQSTFSDLQKEEAEGDQDDHLPEKI